MASEALGSVGNFGKPSGLGPPLEAWESLWNAPELVEAWTPLEALGGMSLGGAQRMPCPSMALGKWGRGIRPRKLAPDAGLAPARHVLQPRSGQFVQPTERMAQALRF